MTKITKNALLARVQELEAREEKRKEMNRVSVAKLRAGRAEQGWKRVKMRGLESEVEPVRAFLGELREWHQACTTARDALALERRLARICAFADEVRLSERNTARGEDLREFEVTLRDTPDFLDPARRVFCAIAGVFCAWGELTEKEKRAFRGLLKIRRERRREAGSREIER